jgi:hypothetical protein
MRSIVRLARPQMLPLISVSRRFQSTSTPPSEEAPVRLSREWYTLYANSLFKVPSYRPLYRPFAKVFLTAMFTYQVLFWCWEKLRLDELREEKEQELHGLEEQARMIVEKQKNGKENLAAGLTIDGRKKGWFSW